MRGGRPEGLVLPPHIFADMAPDAPLAREEIFGPIAPVIRARGEEDAFGIANGTEYGLSSNFFTRDPERGVRFARRLKVGLVPVNDQPVNDRPNSPFGGEKNSDIGRFNRRWAIDAFTIRQWVSVPTRPCRLPADARAIQAPWAKVQGPRSRGRRLKRFSDRFAALLAAPEIPAGASA